jgi:hypothetical protein
VEIYCRLIDVRAHTRSLNQRLVDSALAQIELVGGRDPDQLDRLSSRILMSIAGNPTTDPQLVAYGADRILGLANSGQTRLFAEGVAMEALARSNQFTEAHNRIAQLLADLNAQPGLLKATYDARAFGPLLTAASISLRMTEQAGSHDPDARQRWLALVFECLKTFRSYGPPPDLVEGGLEELEAQVGDLLSRAERLSEELLLSKVQRDSAELGPAGQATVEAVYQHQVNQAISDDALLDRSDSLARLSEARFATVCAKFDWKLIPTPLEADYGIDFRVEIPEKPGRISRDVEFLVQLKSSNQKRDNRGRLRISLRAETMDYWNSKLLPVLVVLYHQPSDRFYAVWHSTEPFVGKTRSYYVSSDAELDHFKVAAGVSTYYQSSRAALTSRGATSVFSRILASSETLLSILLTNDNVRRAMVDSTEVRREGVDTMFMSVVIIGMARLEAPLPLIPEDPATSDIVRNVRLVLAIRNSWLVQGGPTGAPVLISLVAGALFWDSCRHLVTVLADLTSFLALQLATTNE